MTRCIHRLYLATCSSCTASAHLAASVTAPTESARIADRIKQLRDAEDRTDEQAPYWCPTCDVTCHHERCWRCGRRGWTRQIRDGYPPAFRGGDAA